MEQSIEYRNLNENIDYPFFPGADIPSNYITDAIFFLPPPVILKSITKNLDSTYTFMVGYTVEEVQAYIPFTWDGIQPVCYTRWGKMIVTPRVKEIQYSKTYSNCTFLDTVCTNNKSLSLMYKQDALTLTPTKNITENTETKEFTISLPTTDNFTYDCILTINGYAPPDGNYNIERDKCLTIIPDTGVLMLNDICKPPCYDCNARLETGDVHSHLEGLEQRIEDLELHGKDAYKCITLLIDIDKDFTGYSTSLDAPGIIKGITYNIYTAFDPGWDITSAFGVQTLLAGCSWQEQQEYHSLPYYYFASTGTFTLTKTGTSAGGNGQVVVEIYKKGIA